MRCTSLWRTTSSDPKCTNSMPGMPADVGDVGQTGALAAREVVLGRIAGDHDLGAEAEAREEHLHLLGRRVLRLVEDDERVVQRASAHERERSDLDHALLHVRGQAVGVEHVVEGVEERRRYGSTFASMSPGRKPSRSPASTAGRVRMMRATSRSTNAETASAIAR